MFEEIATNFLWHWPAHKLAEFLPRMSDKDRRGFIIHVDKVCKDIALLWDLWSITSATAYPVLNKQKMEQIIALGCICSAAG